MEEKATEPGDFIDRIDGDVFFLGDGFHEHAGLIRQRLQGRARFAPPNRQWVRASSVALLGVKRYGKGEMLDVSTFTPRYLRRSEADIRHAGKP
jgi:tRNA threonylcarbamoyladenosine biosynthesis protein TsaB